jgi:hypothetical protein
MNNVTSTPRFKMYCLMAVALICFAGVAQAAHYVVDGEAGCLTLPASTWTASGDKCTLDADLNLGTLDTLTVDNSVALSIPAGLTVTVNGGIITNDARILMSGDLVNTGGGLVITNSNGSTIDSSNQLHLTQATLENNGTLVNTSVVSVAGTSHLNNHGTFTNDHTVRVEGSLNNTGTLHNNGSVDIQCGSFSNSGTLTGNPIDNTYCWVGGSGNWSDPAHWNQGVVPPPGVKIIFSHSGATATVDVNTTITESLTIKLGTVLVAPGVTFVNDGRVSTMGGNFPGTSVFRNDGNVINNFEFFNNNQIDNRGTFENFGMVDINSHNGGIVNANLAVYINYDGAFTLNGIDNLAGGSMINFGEWQVNRSENSNRGIFANFAGGVFTMNNRLFNEGGGQIENRGVFNVTHALNFPGKIDNDGSSTIVNYSGAVINVIDADTSIENRGEIQNFATIDNGGVINNPGRICGPGSVVNNPVLGNPPVPSCNRPPNAIAKPDGGIFECTGGTTQIILDGSASDDPDGDVLNYAWTPAAPLSNPAIATTSGNFALGQFGFNLTVTDPEGESDSDGASFQVQDTTDPVLTCSLDLTVAADASCRGHADPQSSAADVCDATPGLSRQPAGTDWPLGLSQVQHTAVDASGNQSMCTSEVLVVDVTPPAVECNGSDIATRGRPIAFQGTAADNCSVVSLQVTDFNCWAMNPRGRLIDRNNDCDVRIEGDTLTVFDPSGVGTHIDWTLLATDGSGNSTEVSCGVLVLNPGRGRRR